MSSSVSTHQSEKTKSNKSSDSGKAQKRGWEPWSGKEIQVFFESLERYGRDFEQIQQAVGTKHYQQVSSSTIFSFGIDRLLFLRNDSMSETHVAFYRTFLLLRLLFYLARWLTTIQLQIGASFLLPIVEKDQQNRRTIRFASASTSCHICVFSLECQ